MITNAQNESDFEICRIDSSNSRIFISIDSTNTENIQIISQILSSINKSFYFKSGLRVSFFSDCKYANYKDFLFHEEGIQYSIFYENYLAEYNKDNFTYWTNRKNGNRKNKYKLELPTIVDGSSTK